MAIAEGRTSDVSIRLIQQSLATVQPLIGQQLSNAAERSRQIDRTQAQQEQTALDEFQRFIDNDIRERQFQENILRDRRDFSEDRFRDRRDFGADRSDEIFDRQVQGAQLGVRAFTAETGRINAVSADRNRVNDNQFRVYQEAVDNRQRIIDSNNAIREQNAINRALGLPEDESGIAPVPADPRAPQAFEPVSASTQLPSFNGNGSEFNPLLPPISSTARVTRYGFEGDRYQSQRATTPGSPFENIGNRDNILEDGTSVALSPELAEELGIDLKAGEYVEAILDGQILGKFRVDDTTARGLKDNRLDFFDPSGSRINIDGQTVQVRRASPPTGQEAGQAIAGQETLPPVDGNPFAAPGEPLPPVVQQSGDGVTVAPPSFDPTGQTTPPANYAPADQAQSQPVQQNSSPVPTAIPPQPITNMNEQEVSSFLSDIVARKTFINGLPPERRRSPRVLADSSRLAGLEARALDKLRSLNEAQGIMEDERKRRKQGKVDAEKQRDKIAGIQADIAGAQSVADNASASDEARTEAQKRLGQLQVDLAQEQQKLDPEEQEPANIEAPEEGVSIDPNPGGASLSPTIEGILDFTPTIDLTETPRT